MMTIKQKIIRYFKRTDNAPASYYDLMKHVTLSASLATNVAAMLESGELVEVIEGEVVRVRLAPSHFRAKIAA